MDTLEYVDIDTSAKIPLGIGLVNDFCSEAKPQLTTVMVIDIYEN